jgi:hypothetical protein
MIVVTAQAGSVPGTYTLTVQRQTPGRSTLLKTATLDNEVSVNSAITRLLAAIDVLVS